MDRAAFGTYRRDDALALLSYVAKHHPHCTLNQLATATGIPFSTLNGILLDAAVNGEGSIIGLVAKRYRYIFVVYPEVMLIGRRNKRGDPRKLIDAEWRGYH